MVSNSKKLNLKWIEWNRKTNWTLRVRVNLGPAW